MNSIRNKSCFLLVFLFASCQTKNKSSFDFPPPPPPPNIIPDFPAPTYIPFFPEGFVMQINPIPHPLSVNGEIPFAIWLNGKRLELSNQHVKNLTQSLNVKYEKPLDTAEIHSGEGWQYPLKANE